MLGPINQATVGKSNLAETVTFLALLIVTFPIGPLLVALLLNANLTVYWLSWADLFWLLPSLWIACSLMAVILFFPTVAVGWVLVRLLKNLSSTASFAEGLSLQQVSILVAFMAWTGSIAGGLLFIIWKAARHSFSNFS